MSTDNHYQPPPPEFPQVLVLRPPPVFKAHEQEFATKFTILKAYESPLPTHLFLTTHAQSVKAILCSGQTPITTELLTQLPSVQFVVTASTGVNHLDLSECRRRGIAVANVGNVYSEDVAEAAVGLLIDVLRRITAADRFVRGGLWPVKGNYPLGSKLGGKRVGIVGLGSIGSEVAKRLEALGCIISYTSRNQKQSNIPYPFYSYVTDLASNSDALIICCALTSQTHHMINKQVMKALGKSGVIVNVARGAIVDEKELVKCLVEREIAGAGLDVFENEPNVPKELFGLDNVVLLSHSTGFTIESFCDASQLLIGNIEAFFLNKPLLTPVSTEE